MEKVSVNLEYCYGINKLVHVFDFDKPAISIYAPNGMMKTSLAKTFRDISSEVESKDLMFSERVTSRIVLNESNEPLDAGSIFVIDPYDKEFKSKKMSTLLVNRELRERYDNVHLEIDESVAALVKEIKPLTGLSRGIEEEISTSFTFDTDKLFVSLERIEKEVTDGTEPKFSDIKYKNVFNDKVLGFLDTRDFKDRILDYMKTYDELLDASSYFKKGVFNHNNATTIAKNLTDNGFFKANHSVSLNSGTGATEITNEVELVEVIDKEKQAILNNEDLEKAFNDIDTKLKANKELRDFREYLIENMKILPELGNVQSFRQNLWVSYFKSSIESYKRLLEVYLNGKKELDLIVGQAKEERTSWMSVLEIFNERFSVPFHLEISNQDDVILKEQVPSVKFTFKEHGEEANVKEGDLLQALSNGEKRALYILNIIFEVEARKSDEQETLFVIDDIADSFDYKNKYAIIEYLREIAKEDFFSQIILTHNFDFFRTIESRFVGRQHSLMVTKTANEILLIGAEYLKPFSYFKDNLHQDNAILIGSIPFVRNLIEYTNSSLHEDFLKLTSVLHVKEGTSEITVSDLQIVFDKVLENKIELPNGDKKVVELIFELADDICDNADIQVNLENKIVLSVGIRLRAEYFMIHNIADKDVIGKIKKNQTAKLFELYASENADKAAELKLLEQVNLMTPENIHLNSFMYEPILDMADEHLQQLYKQLGEM